MKVGDLVKVKISEEDPDHDPPVIGIVLQIYDSGAGHPRVDIFINGWDRTGWFLPKDLEVISNAGR